ncbi:D-amino acid dehydrogenase [Microvirga rosea]|uniref:D-amino acid dehydrogenase n=1 Tax=Microvirga rosea TaxID=2715425 RepID=UPI001D0A81FD|nr:D-amino acid dehydrogenase [Microvirga rosea]MCB8822483.1 D-amino acid dehydrogenase [Microvirga rosea]
MRRICVIGGGVIGAATAYYLSGEGHHVTLVEREAGPGLGASYGNGGQLSYSYVAPLAAPGLLLKLPALLLQHHSALRFRPEFDKHQWRWCLDFLRACNTAVSDRTTCELLSLSALSRDETHRTARQEALDFDFRNSGKLVFFRDESSFAAARRQVSMQAKFGQEQIILSERECVEREPALADVERELRGGVLTPSEDAGDCYKFTHGLIASLKTRPNVNLRFGFDVQRLRRDGPTIRAASGPQGEIDADVFVVAGGFQSRSLLQPCGVDLPLYPLKGYSLTVPTEPSSPGPNLSVTDSDNKIVYARLGDKLRIAAMVDIGATSGDVEAARLEQLRRQVRSSFPKLSLKHSVTWSGSRPATPRGKPIITQVADSNLWLNVGHGALGFTLACGSARLLSDLIFKRPPVLDPQPFAFAGHA